MMVLFSPISYFSYSKGCTIDPVMEHRHNAENCHSTHPSTEGPLIAISYLSFPWWLTNVCIILCGHPYIIYCSGLLVSKFWELLLYCVCIILLDLCFSQPHVTKIQPHRCVQLGSIIFTAVSFPGLQHIILLSSVLLLWKPLLWIFLNLFSGAHVQAFLTG